MFWAHPHTRKIVGKKQWLYTLSDRKASQAKRGNSKISRMVSRCFTGTRKMRDLPVIICLFSSGETSTFWKVIFRSSISNSSSFSWKLPCVYGRCSTSVSTVDDIVLFIRKKLQPRADVLRSLCFIQSWAQHNLIFEKLRNACLIWSVTVHKPKLWEAGIVSFSLITWQSKSMWGQFGNKSSEWQRSEYHA